MFKVIDIPDQGHREKCFRRGADALQEISNAGAAPSRWEGLAFVIIMLSLKFVLT